MDSSCIEEGVAVFSYTWLYDNNADTRDVNISPKYPICVTITSFAVKFILQYCVYKYHKGGEDEYLLSLSDLDAVQMTDKDSVKIRHMESVLLELPFTSNNNSILSAIIKRIYHTPFPIKPKDKGGNYIINLLEQRFKNDERQRPCNSSFKDVHYSSLPVWDLTTSGNSYELKDEDNNYPKFLRKLFLDFLFDMMHGDVFHNSVHFGQMYEKLMSDFFVAAIVKKSEFYYQRELVREVCRPQNDKSQDIVYSEAITIYAESFDIAEKHWLEYIQSPLADKHFVFTPNWYECKDVSENSSSSSNQNKYTWFAQPEEELRRVFFKSKSIAEGQEISSKGGDAVRKKTKEEIYSSADLLDRCEKNGSSENLNKLKLSFSILRLQLRNEVVVKWLLRRYNFGDVLRCGRFWGGNVVSYVLLLLIVTAICMRYYPLALMFVLSLGVWFVCSSFIRRRASGWRASLRSSMRQLLDNLQLLLPRLLASITAAWLTIALGEDLFKAFFDMKFNWWSFLGLLIATFIFILHEIDKIVPYLKGRVKIARAFHLLLISFTMSLLVGIVVINFTGELFLERSGYLSEFYRDKVLVRSDANKNGEPALTLNFMGINSAEELTDSIIMNVYTHSPYNKGYLDYDEVPHIGGYIHHPEKYIPFNTLSEELSRLAVYEFATSPESEYITRIASVYDKLDSLKKEGLPIAAPICGSEALISRLILNHKNNALLKDLLAYVEHNTRNKHSVVLFYKPKLLGGYKFFVLHDFLIQFAVVAMFIGIFVQMMFEGKNITE